MDWLLWTLRCDFVNEEKYEVLVAEVPSVTTGREYVSPMTGELQEIIQSRSIYRANVNWLFVILSFFSIQQSVSVLFKNKNFLSEAKID
jgi:hypothetical protein